jgi:hypothetical protein
MLKSGSTTKLRDLIEKNEEWLIERILGYAIRQGYSAYTSTLKAAWRLSISGLSTSIIEALQTFNGQPPEMTPEEDFTDDPVTQFGILEAQRHRERGVSLNMFLGLMKYYRQSYTDLIRQSERALDVQDSCHLFIKRVFDRIEIGFCVEWSGARENKGLHELQIRNLLMTNEKNKYLTIFESIPNPVIMLNRAMEVDNMNLAAARLVEENQLPGSQYYGPSKKRRVGVEQCPGPDGNVLDPESDGGSELFERLPWLKADVVQFYETRLDSMMLEKRIRQRDRELVFRVNFSKSLDFSAKFQGTIIILEDITSLRNALNEVKTLRGLLPICSYCKNIRTDKGAWQKVEDYVQDRSDAEFSHGICPDCANKYYPDLHIYDE